MESVANYFRTKAIIKAALPFVKDSPARVLDIGAGSCHIAKTLSVKHGFSVTAIDVADHNVTNFPLRLYAGKKLPYADNSFDVGLLVFVLHHASNAKDLLKEAKRVCKQVVVIEDLPTNTIERMAWKRLDYLLNHAQHKDIAIAHEAKTYAAWKDLFTSQDYRIVKTKKFRSLCTSGLLFAHIIFVLSPSPKT